MSKIEYAVVVTYVKCESGGEYDEKVPCPFHDDHEATCRAYNSDDNGCYHPKVRKLLGVENE